MAFDLDVMRVLVAVLDHGSFSAAARALGKVPSAVSMAIANLEAELDVALFDRSGREPRPTPQALALAPQVRQLLDQSAQLERQALSLTQGLESCLTLAVAPELLAATPWSSALATLAGEHPLLEVRVLAAPQADALDMLHGGRAQLALVFERPAMTAREGFLEVGRETLVAVIAPSHPLMRRRAGSAGLREDHLAAERQIVVAGRDSDQIDSRIVLGRRLWRTDDPVAALSMVVAGLGWAWLPRGFVQAPLAAGQLVGIPTRNFTNALPLCVDVVWSKTRPLGLAAQRLVALLGETRQHPPAPRAAEAGAAARAPARPRRA